MSEVITGTPVATSKESYGMQTWLQKLQRLFTDLNTSVTTLNTTVANTPPTGCILDYAGTSAPTGWLVCDGSAVSRTTYADLFAAIGTTWGAGDGSTTFNLPSLARRTTIGSGGAGTGTIGNAVGNTGGEETHTLTAGESGLVDHNHSASSSGSGQVYTSGALGGNTVAVDGTGAALQNATGSLANPRGSLALSISTTVNNSGSSSASSAHNTMQPSAVVLKIIKY